MIETVMEQKLSMNQGGDLNLINKTGLYLLSLDGGRVKGLSTLYILKNLITRMNSKCRKDKLPLVKPCEVFDLIGGTNTGGYM